VKSVRKGSDRLSPRSGFSARETHIVPLFPEIVERRVLEEGIDEGRREVEIERADEVKKKGMRKAVLDEDTGDPVDSFGEFGVDDDVRRVLVRARDEKSNESRRHRPQRLRIEVLLRLPAMRLTNNAPLLGERPQLGLIDHREVRPSLLDPSEEQVFDVLREAFDRRRSAVSVIVGLDELESAGENEETASVMHCPAEEKEKVNIDRGRKLMCLPNLRETPLSDLQQLKGSASADNADEGRRNNVDARFDDDEKGGKDDR
jgi:hypothetical protein